MTDSLNLLIDELGCQVIETPVVQDDRIDRDSDKLSWIGAEMRQHAKRIMIPKRMKDSFANVHFRNWFFTSVFSFIQFREQYNRNCEFVTVCVPDQFAEDLGQWATIQIINGRYYMTTT